MTTLITRIPDVDVLIELPPEELALTILQLAYEHKGQNGLVHPQSLLSHIYGTPGLSEGYPQNRRSDAELAFNEAWNWLAVQGILISDLGPNGNNGWMRFGRKATELLTQESFDNYARSVAFPKTLLHPSIANLNFA